MRVEHLPPAPRHPPPPAYNSSLSTSVLTLLPVLMPRPSLPSTMRRFILCFMSTWCGF